MKRMILFICWSGMVFSVWAVTYRDFTDTQGRTIRGRVLKFNFRTKMVTFERENKRLAKVPLSIFSESDQAYIQNIGISNKKPSEPKKELTLATEFLSKKAIEAIAEQYVEALKKKDLDALDRLFYKSAWDRTEYRWKSSNSSGSLEDVDMGKVVGNNIHVIAAGAGSTDLGMAGWLQLTPDGKIKYCPLIAPHPVEKAYLQVARLFHSLDQADSTTQRTVGLWMGKLNETGIPMFGLRSDMTRREKKEALEEIRDWLIENGATYDNTEPKLFLPSKQMKLIERALKSL